MEKHIDYNMISNTRGMNEKMQRLEEEIDRCEYVCLTDALDQRERGGQLALLFLDDELKFDKRDDGPRMWRLRVLRHADGKPVKPGDKIVRRIPRPLKDRAGNKINSRSVNRMIQSGEYERNYVRKKTFVVDRDGCISCSYQDAGYFLTSFGVHYTTGFAICGKREVSGGGGKAKATWNWLYVEEVPWGLDEDVFPKQKK